VLLRDEAALSSLIAGTLTPLLQARGGPGPLLQTLLAYFDGGGNSARAARALHLSVRAVTYRLSRVRELTGHDPATPEGRLTLHLAALGARLLDWPASLP
jgi:DNA-binding PucR family transcriptional regulator